jgi:hypothetical protein
MGNSKVYLGNINIGNAKLGTSDVKLYLGDMLVYPFGPKVFITYDVATYNGTLQTAQNIVVTDESGNTLVENVDYVVTENNGGTNAGTYNLIITLMGQYQGTARTNFVINKVTPTVIAPTTISGLIYNGTSQALVSAGSVDWGALKYSLDDETYDTTIPSGINASSYTVYYKVEGDSNVNDVAEQNFVVSIAKVTPTVVIPTAVTGLVYNATEQTLVNGGFTDYGTLKYSLDNVTYSVSSPKGINASSYTVYYKVEGDSNVNDVAADSATTTIAKVTPTVVAPTAKVLTYNTQAQELVNAGSTNYGTLKYSLDNSTWSTSIPTATNYGSYTVYYKVDGDSNVNDVAAQSVACSINEKQVTATVELSQSAYTYNGSACEPTVTVKDGSTVIDPSEYTVTYSNNINAGTATVTISDNVGGNYEVIGSATFAIDKADVTYTAPTTVSSLVYNGNAQELLNAGTVTGGTIKYSTDNVNWSTDVPSGTNASSYTSYWKIDGDANHNDVASSSIVTTIAKADSSLSFTVTNLTVGIGKTKTNAVTVNAGDGVVTYISNNTSVVTVNNSGVVTGVSSGNTTVSANISSTSNYNSATTSYNVACAIVVIAKFNVTDTSSPTKIMYHGAYSQFSAIEIDGVVQPSVLTGYTFSTTGEHTVKYYLKSTSIGGYAFYNCSSLTSINIPNSVTSIDGHAFAECYSLKSIDIPNSVTSIGSQTFYNCTGLTSCTMGSGVTSIGENAFAYCRSLTSINIPDSVTSIAEQAFYTCTSLTSVTVEAITPPTLGVKAFDSTNNCPIYVPCDSVDAYKAASRWSSYASRIQAIAGSCPPIVTAKFNVTSTSGPTRIVGNSPRYSPLSGVSSIEIDGVVQSSLSTGYTFSATGEHTVTYYLKQDSIPGYSFHYCSGMTSCDIGDDITSVGEWAFYQCSGLTSCTIGSGVTSIGSCAFSYCRSLTSIDIPDSVATIGDYFTFGDCSNLTSCTFAEGSQLKVIGTSVFDGCTSLTSIDIPDSVTSIGKSAFSSCSSLTSCTIGSGVTSIGNTAFYDCYSLTSIDIPDSVTSIGNSAFYDCYSLTSCTIGSGVTTIGDSAFQNCKSLTGVTLPDSLTSIGVGAFGKCSGFTSIDIPDSVTSIGGGAFYECTRVTSITIPSGVTSIGVNPFHSCSGLTSIVVENGNSAYDSRNNCNAIIETSTNALISGCKNTVIPSDVTSIGTSAFERCSSLRSINIPNSVTSIGNSAFERCSSLRSCTIGSGVTSIGNGAFSGCTSLTSCTIGSGVTSIGNTAFYDCRRLTSITLPDSVTSIGESVFYGCSSLTSINIPSGVTSIGKSAFDLCTGLTSIDIPDSVTNIGNFAFYRCSGLTSCTIGSGVTSIGIYAFCDCTSLTSIVCNATTAPTIQSSTFQRVKTGGVLTVPIGSSGYDVWMGTGSYYLGMYNWTKVEQ